MRAAVVDADYHAAFVVEVGDFDPRAEGQATVGSGHAVLVEGFATGGAFTVVSGAVIGGGAGLVVTAGVDIVAGAAGQQGEERECAEGTPHQISCSEVK
ncbi:hypothetical protein D3C76_1403850 [compost metagenome]